MFTFEFDVQVRANGGTEEEAWLEAVAALALDPGLADGVMICNECQEVLMTQESLTNGTCEECQQVQEPTK